MKNFIWASFLTFAMPIFGQTLYFDNFETAQTWTIFEELVAGNACYGGNIGEVARSTEVAHEGSTSLRVWSNKNGSTKSNHVIAAHHISNTDGITGRLRVGMWAYCATTIGLTQSGPEFSLQSTRLVGGQNLTHIAGIQYIGNQWITNKWNIWHNGVWKEIQFSEFGTTLTSNTWYYVELEFDMTTNRYIAFKIQGSGLNQTLDLTQNFQNATSGFLIGAEARNWTPSYFVTAESENLWTTCTQVHENKVYYDEVKVERVNAISKVILVEEGTIPLKIYPTLVHDFLHVETIDNQDFQIVNMMGQIVMTGKTMTPIYIGVAHLPRGSYVFKVGTQQARFILN
jgi:hypothetical protein